MAIYSAVPPPPELQSSQQPNAQSPNASQQSHPAPSPIDIEAWTISALESLTVSTTTTATTATPLSIPLDDPSTPRANARSTARVTITVDGVPATDATTRPSRPAHRRDSLRRRELLLKGKEGSRQRRRYNMKCLADVPNVEPPEPSDWEPRPVYPVHHVPYHVATFWERGLRQQVEDKEAAARKNKAAGHGAGRVPRELRDTAKRTPGVRGWLRSLEEPVRQFLVDSHAAGGGEVLEDESDESDDEVVFVGRKAAPRPRDDQPRGSWKWARREVGDRPVDRGIIFDSAEDDGSGAFKRWLTHSISDYYGLVSRSVTMGTPARRCVYVGIREVDMKIRTAIPRPLWELF